MRHTTQKSLLQECITRSRSGVAQSDDLRKTHRECETLNQMQAQSFQYIFQKQTAMLSDKPCIRSFFSSITLRWVNYTVDHRASKSSSEYAYSGLQWRRSFTIQFIFGHNTYCRNNNVSPTVHLPASWTPKKNTGLWGALCSSPTCIIEPAETSQK